jgi:hypothetical protein
MIRRHFSVSESAQNENRVYLAMSAKSMGNSCVNQTKKKFGRVDGGA